MFLKRRKQNKESAESFADRERQRLTYQCFAEQRRLQQCVKTAITRRGVISLYPDGPDKDCAIRDFEKSNHSLLCAIGAVDAARAELRQYIEKHKGEFVSTVYWWTPIDDYGSHRIVEETYKNFFKS